MSQDLRARRTHTRPATGAFLFDPWKPKKLLGCFGGLTSGINLSIGTAVGQITGAQLNTTNLLFNTYAPSVPPWVLNGAAILTGLGQSWDINFLASGWRGNGVADFVSNPTIVNTGLGVFTISTQFSDGGTSNAARFGVSWKDAGNAQLRLDSIDINPITGQFLAKSANLFNIQIDRFSAFVAGTSRNITKVSFSVPILPGATVSGEYQLYPNITGGGNLTVTAGGFQAEQNVPVTAFVPTPVNASASRQFGVIPRLLANQNIPPRILAANYVYQNVLDSAGEFNVTVNSVQISLPAVGNPGEWFDVYFTGTTFCVIQGSGGTLISMPGLAPGGVGILRFPYDGVVPAGGVGPYNVCGLHLICTAAGLWTATAIAETHGTQLFTANGTLNARDGMTAIWVDGTGGGGGGGGVAAINSGGGGGNGANAVKDVNLTTVPGTAYTITIGTGGNGGAAGNNNGVAGTSTTIGALLTLTGGAFGNGAATGTFSGASAVAAAGASQGGMGFGTTTQNFSGSSGSTIFSAPQPGVAIANPNGGSPGIAGALYGGGGSGGASGTGAGPGEAGGNGANGFASIKW